MRVKVKIPATSANLGSGFDCIGVALNLYNYVEVEVASGGLEVILPESDVGIIPADERNLVYKAALAIYKKAGKSVPGLKITLINNIPVTRGLGSSSASIIGGLYAANSLCGSVFSKEELMKISADIEGHPDNVIPAIAGGITVASIEPDKVYYVSHPVPEDVTFAVVVPDFHLATKSSRNKLPELLSYSDAIYNIGRASLLMSSFITGKYENLKSATSDRLHQRYRLNTIKGAKELFEVFDQMGALGKYLSGSGPALAAILKGNELQFETDMQKFLNENFPAWKLYMLKADNSGVIIEQEV